MKSKASQNAHRGSDFREFLAGEGILPEVEALALKRGVSVLLLGIFRDEVRVIGIGKLATPMMGSWKIANDSCPATLVSGHC